MIPSLTDVLSDDLAFIRLRAVRVVGEFRTNDLPAVPALTGLLNDTHSFVRVHASNALTAIRNPPRAIQAFPTNGP